MAGQCQAGEGEHAERRSAQVSWGEVGDGGVLGGFDAADGEHGGERQREHGGLQTRYRHWPFRYFLLGEVGALLLETVERPAAGGAQGQQMTRGLAAAC